MVNNFQEFLNEERSISNTVLDYTNIIIKIFKNRSFCKEIIDLKNSDLPLYNLNIIFEEDLHWNGKSVYNNTELIGNKLYNGIIHIFIKDEFNFTEIRNIIAHELTHFLIFYKTFKSARNFNQKISKSIIKINVTKLPEFFKLVYLSTDNEINANIHNVYTYLLKICPKNDKIIEENLKETEYFINSENMIEFRATDFLNNQKLNILGIAKIINEFNLILIKENIEVKYFNIKINEIDENIAKKQLLIYFKIWEKIFNKQGKKFKFKLLKLVGKIYDDKDIKLDENIEFFDMFGELAENYRKNRIRKNKLNKLI